MSDIHEMQERAIRVAELYDSQNRSEGKPSWGPSEIMSGYVGDIGALSKLVMAHVGLRDIPDYEAKLKHEIGDNFWSLLVLCGQLGVDPAEALNDTMDELEARFEEGKA